MAAPRREDMRKGIILDLTTALSSATSDTLKDVVSLEAELDSAEQHLQEFVAACEDVQGKYVNYPSVVKIILDAGDEAFGVLTSIQGVRKEQDKIDAAMIAGWLIAIRQIRLSKREERA